jgi:hypothetical protein
MLPTLIDDPTPAVRHPPTPALLKTTVPWESPQDSLQLRSRLGVVLTDDDYLPALMR